MSACKVRRWTQIVLFNVMRCVALSSVGISLAHAQQQTPPRAPELLRIYKPFDASQVTLEKHEAFKADVFKGLTLPLEQQMMVIRNLDTLGCSSTRVMQPAKPAHLPFGDACRTSYTGTQKELRALRKVVTDLIRKNKASDVAPFEEGIPKDCPDKELYYYLDLLAQVTGGT